MTLFTITKLNKNVSFDATIKCNKPVYVFNAEYTSIVTNILHKEYICVDASLISLPEEYPFTALVRPSTIFKGLIAVDRFIIVPNEELVLN